MCRKKCVKCDEDLVGGCCIHKFNEDGIIYDYCLHCGADIWNPQRLCYHERRGVRNGRQKARVNLKKL